MSRAASGPSAREWRDAAGWGVLTLVGLAAVALAVEGGAQLGTASAPFLGRYRWEVGPASLLAPGMALTVLLVAARGWFDGVRWGVVLVWSYVAALAWALALAWWTGRAG
jgi:hypothetical protein